MGKVRGLEIVKLNEIRVDFMTLTDYFIGVLELRNRVFAKKVNSFQF